MRKFIILALALAFLAVAMTSCGMDPAATTTPDDFQEVVTQLGIADYERTANISEKKWADYAAIIISQPEYFVHRVRNVPEGFKVVMVFDHNRVLIAEPSKTAFYNDADGIVLSAKVKKAKFAKNSHYKECFAYMESADNINNAYCIVNIYQLDDPHPTSMWVVDESQRTIQRWEQGLRPAYDG